MTKPQAHLPTLSASQLFVLFKSTILYRPITLCDCRRPIARIRDKKIVKKTGDCPYRNNNHFIEWSFSNIYSKLDQQSTPNW